LQEDSSRIRAALITPKAHNPQKRKAENELNRVEFNGTPKRCEPIERITRDLTDYVRKK
jgi:hypothetical protein